VGDLGAARPSPAGRGLSALTWRSLSAAGDTADDGQCLQLQRVHDCPDIGLCALVFMLSFLNPLLHGSPDGFCLRNARTQAIVADHLEAAFDSDSRRTGLLRRASFPEGHALIIAPTNAIHTFFMKFPIDVAFVAKDGRIVKTRSRLRAWRLAAAWRAYAVIELPAGALDRSLTVAGDLLVVVSR
jgi:uncharacterized membrane protein (UPF0127 family)